MKKELILTPEVKAIVEAIKNTGKVWYEIQLPDHPVYPQFIRKLVVTGFNTPDLEGDEDRIYINVRQYLILEEENKIHKRLQMPDWMIHEGNVEEIMGKNGVLKAEYVIKDDTGKIVESGEEALKAQSVQYIRFLIKTKSVHLVDIFAQFIGMYIPLFDQEINDI